jgi:hypothetical protein
MLNGARTLRNQILVSIGISAMMNKCYEFSILIEFVFMLAKHPVMFGLQVGDSRFQLLLDIVGLLELASEPIIFVLLDCQIELAPSVIVCELINLILYLMLFILYSNHAIPPSLR